MNATGRQLPKNNERHISNDTSQTANISAKPDPTCAAVKLSQRAVLTRNFFSPLGTTDMDTDTTGAEGMVPEQEPPR